MRRIGFLAVSALAAASSIGLAAPAADRPAAAEWITSVEISRQTGSFPGVEVTIPRRALALTGYLTNWISEEDVPQDLRRRAFEDRSLLLLDIDATGQATACRSVQPSRDPRLDQIGCDRLLKRGRFAARYIGPGRSIPYQWLARLTWRTQPRPQPSPAATSLPLIMLASASEPEVVTPLAGTIGWPRLRWDGGVQFEPLPDIQSLWPGTGEAVISLDLTRTAGESSISCVPAPVLQDASLRSAACTAARTVPMRYLEPCEICDPVSVPLQIVWKKQGSYIRTPRLPATAEANPVGDPVETRRSTLFSEALSRRPFARLKSRDVQREVPSLLVEMDQTGKALWCYMAHSSGNLEIDQQLCALVMDGMRFEVRTDVFGDAKAEMFTLPIDLRPHL